MKLDTTDQISMSYREKSAWIALLLDVGLYGYYAWHLVGAIQRGETETFEYYSLLSTLIVILIIATIVLEAIVAGASPKEANAPADERERMISLKASNVAYYVVAIAALMTAGAIAYDQPAFYTVNFLFLAVVVADVMRYATMIIYFRRGG